MSTSNVRVSIVGTNGLPANYGGFETLVSKIHEQLSIKFNLTVYCSKLTDPKLKYIRDTRLIRLPFRANGIESFIYDFISIFHALIRSDVIIILGLSGGFALPLIKLFRKKIIYNPGGIESSKVRGIRGLMALENLIKTKFDNGFYKAAHFIVLDNESFFKGMLKYNNKLRLIEYGGEDYNNLGLHTFDIFKEYDISVSRAQEDMNILMVLEAYVGTDRNIIIVSNWLSSNYGRYLYNMYSNKYQNILLLNAIYDKAELNKLRSNASVYIHSHTLCGTAPSLVEAMSLGLAVISHDTLANRYTTENSAEYYNNSKELNFLLSKLRKEWIMENKIVMKEIASKRYNWELIANKYIELIDDIIE